MIKRRFELPRVLVLEHTDRLQLTRGQIRTELRRGTWRPIAPGIVLTRPDEPTRADWAEVGIALGGPSAALTAWDAARVHGLGSRTPPQGCVIIVTRAGMNRVVGGVRIRRTSRPYVSAPLLASADDLAMVPVVGPARAVADTALELGDVGAVRALVTSAVQRQRCTVEDLVTEYDAGPRNRSRLLRQALSDVLDGARSVAEANTARVLTTQGLPPFELNVPIVTPRGRLKFVVDVLWRSLRAILEVDSREYHFSEVEWKATMHRHNELTRLGFAVVHYPPSVITRSPRLFAADVRDWIAARANELGVSVPSGRGVIRPQIGRSPEPVVICP